MNAELHRRLLCLNADLAATRLSPEDAIWLACDLLVAEVNTPAVVQLASASPKSTYTAEAARLVEQLLVELGVEPMTPRQASWWFARDVARLMAAGKLDREDGENELWALGVELGNADLMPGRLSPAEIVRTADERLRTWTA
ncbi:hypothetical protein SAMN04488564_104516 [Lentzea waywayandensis]|uniref:Uncharacterized protein n=1 Tax=Lentzea waywayandensis TaxID=84724 RepID=A0A1I6EHB7_9PSEU|nr:hypothetical protein [Lentzea waywayandensis]SFR17146.1 hypothetical protein SAMN04488564_104516 [Lentzea waywayandensis]